MVKSDDNQKIAAYQVLRPRIFSLSLARMEMKAEILAKHDGKVS